MDQEDQQLAPNPDLEAVGQDIANGKYSLQSLISDPDINRRQIGNEFMSYMQSHYNTDLSNMVQRPNLAANLKDGPATDNHFLENMAHNANFGTGALMERLGANAVQGYQQLAGSGLEYDPNAVQNAMSTLDKQRTAYAHANPWGAAAGTVAGNIPLAILTGQAAAEVPAVANFITGPNFASETPSLLKAAQMFTSGAGIGDLAKASSDIGDKGQAPTARDMVTTGGLSGALNVAIPSALMGLVKGGGYLVAPTMEKAGQMMENVPGIQNALGAVRDKLGELMGGVRNPADIYSNPDMTPYQGLTEAGQQIVEKNPAVVMRHMQDVTSRPEIQDAFPSLYTPKEIEAANMVRGVAEGGEEPEDTATLKIVQEARNDPRIMSLAQNPNAPQSFFDQNIPGVIYNEAVDNVGINSRNVNTPLREEKNLMTSLRNEATQGFPEASKEWSRGESLDELSKTLPNSIFNSSGATEGIPDSYFNFINQNKFNNFSPQEQGTLTQLAQDYNNKSDALAGQLNPLINRNNPSSSLYHPVKAALSGLMGVPHAVGYHLAQTANEATQNAARGAIGNTLQYLAQKYYLGESVPMLQASVLNEISKAQNGVGSNASDLSNLIGNYMSREYPVATSEKN